MRPYLPRMIAAAVMLAVAGALMSGVVATVKPLIDRVIMPSVGQAAAASGAAPDYFDRLRTWLGWDRWTSVVGERIYFQVPLLLIIVFVVRGIFLYFGEYLTTKSGTSVIRDLRAELYEAITYQSLRFFQMNPTATILSRILNDVSRLQRVTTVVLSDVVKLGTMIPFMLAVAFVHDWRVSLIVVVVLPLMALPMVRLGRKLRRASTRSQENMATVAVRLVDAVVGAKVVQGFAMEPFEIGRFRGALDDMLRADLRAGRAAALAPAVLEILGSVVGGVMFYYAGMNIHRGSLDPGDFAVVLTSLGFLFVSVKRLNVLNLEIQQALAAAARVFDMMDREREIRDAEGAATLPSFREAIRFDAVDFGYDDEKVLEGIDLTIRKGEVLALVGASGSGKTTLTSLVPRFYDPTSGRLTVDDHDVRRVTLASLRSQIGLVTQETTLFNDTVRNNIAYGLCDVPLDRVIEAAKAAHAHPFIERLPEGYDTVVRERGMRFSAGERQRITIARALLKDPPILILDEATSALDAESEKLVQEALDRLMKGRTSIVIAHRLATVRRADRIVVLDAGRIVEVGSHRELLVHGGVYAKLHALQFRDDGAD